MLAKVSVIVCVVVVHTAVAENKLLQVFAEHLVGLEAIMVIFVYV